MEHRLRQIHEALAQRTLGAMTIASDLGAATRETGCSDAGGTNADASLCRSEVDFRPLLTKAG
jgi:hypothetical protein